MRTEDQSDRWFSYWLLLLAGLSVWSAIDARGETAQFILFLLAGVVALLTGFALHPRTAASSLRPVLRVAGLLSAALYVLLRVWTVVDA